MTISAIILNWKRPANVVRIADGLFAGGLVDEVIVWNNNPSEPFRHAQATVVNSTKDMGLYSRFAAACLARNECVLIQDDDLQLPGATLKELHRAWLDDPHILHGIFGRRAKADGSYDPRNTESGEVPIVLCRVILMRRHYAGTFFETAAAFEDIQKESRPHGNGEDIILSYAVRRQTNRMNRVHRLPVMELPAPNAIHGRDWSSHLVHRSRLVKASEAWLEHERIGTPSKRIQNFVIPPDNASPQHDSRIIETLQNLETARSTTPVVDVVQLKGKMIQAPLPRRIYDVFTPGMIPERFNSSLIRFQDRWQMAYRLGRSRSRVALAELDEQLQVIAETVLTFPAHPSARDGQEDPRLFHFRGELWMSYCGLNRPRNTMFLARVTPGGDVLEHFALESPRGERREKNWAFFECDGELHAVYHGSPHSVLRVRKGQAEILPGRSVQLIGGPLGEVRGGAPPIPVNGEWYHWAHGWLHRGRERPLYSISLYTFADRTFEIRRFVPQPIYLPDNVCPVGGIPRVVFPAGAVLDGDRWLISVGEFDSCCRVFEYSWSEIETQLVEVR